MEESLTWYASQVLLLSGGSAKFQTFQSNTARMEKHIPPTHPGDLEVPASDASAPVLVTAPPQLVSANAVDKGRLFSYYEDPFNKKPNGCGQAAMAMILTYWGIMTPNPANPEYLYNDPSTAPDILWGLFGTSWERFLRVMQRAALKAYGQNVTWLASNSSDGKLAMLKKWVDAGCPVAVIIGNGELNLGSGAHWAVVVEVNESRVKLGNLPGGFIEFNTTDFMSAWEARGLPGVHYAGVFAHR